MRQPAEELDTNGLHNQPEDTLSRQSSCAAFAELKWSPYEAYPRVLTNLFAQVPTLWVLMRASKPRAAPERAGAERLVVRIGAWHAYKAD